jgi:hypothetical protein
VGIEVDHQVSTLYQVAFLSTTRFQDAYPGHQFTGSPGLNQKIVKVLQGVGLGEQLDIPECGDQRHSRGVASNLAHRTARCARLVYVRAHNDDRGEVLVKETSELIRALELYDLYARLLEIHAQRTRVLRSI